MDNINNTKNDVTTKSDILKNYSWKFRECIDSIIKKNNYRHYTIEINNMLANNNSFLGKLYEVNIKEKSKNKKEEINLFIKENITMENCIFISLQDIYAKEMFLYNTLTQIVNKLQVEANILEEDRYKFPKSYKETNADLIVLENLSLKGFKTYPRKNVMSINYARLAVAELAKFHSLSFVIQNKMPEFFAEHIETLKSAYITDNEWKLFINMLCVNISEMFEGIEKQKILNFLPRFEKKFPVYCSPSKQYKNCLSHGDYRVSNILVRDKDDVPEEVIPIDFQLIDYGIPIRDFLFFIAAGTDREFRKKHLEEIKDVYYDTMTRFLRYFDLDVNNIYPRSEFEETYKECHEYGLMIGIKASIFIFAHDADDIGINTKKLSEYYFNPDDSYKQRIQEILEEFTD